MGAQHLRVPYGLIRALCYPGGVRLDPRVSKVRPPEPDVEAVQIPWTSSWSPSSGVAATVSPSIVRPEQVTSLVPVRNPTSVHIIDGKRLDVMGNLSNELYKFFMGSHIKTSSFFTCRGCMMSEYTAVRRTVHFAMCRTLMQAIEERVRRDKVCVICNQGTHKECWRIPLCSEPCIAKWRFSIPEPWLVARRFVLAAQPQLMRIKCESTPINS